MQQPYGYREQNKFNSESNMICDAIGKGGSSEEKEKQINEILNKAFFDARFDNGRFVFSNSYGADVDNFKSPYEVESAVYDYENEKIVITFKEDTISPIEIPLEELLAQVGEMVAEEEEERINEDEKIWDAIGEIGASGTSLAEMIQKEISDRIEGDTNLLDAINDEVLTRSEEDENLWNAINQEASARTNEDNNIWEAIGEISTSGTSIIELINQEVSARTEGDNDIWDALNQEASARTSEDNNIWEAIGEISTSGTSIIELINQEVSARTEGDNDIWDALNQEISARTEGDNAEELARIEGDEALNTRVDDEKAARVYWFGVLSGAIITERSERANEDNNLWDALNQEISARTEGDDALDDKIEQEAIDRSTADGVLEGKIEVEKTEREAADNELDTKITDEKESRIHEDEILSNAIEREHSEREAEDTRIWEAISAETEARIAADEAIIESIDDNKVSIVKVTSTLPSNVREAYELKNTLGAVLGDRINIYKDSSLRSVELVDEHEGVHGQFLKFTYILEDGSESVQYVDVSQFLVEAEFKDGLMVTASREVKVKVDPSSESYLTVSTNGVKISGVDAISQALALETLNRENADTRLEASITNEITARQSADNDLQNALNDEIDARESGDSELNTKLSNEKAERIADDAALGTRISRETTDRENGDQSLFGLITQLNTDLSTEVGNRVNGDSALQGQINDLKAADIEIRSSVAAVESNLLTETSNRSIADSNLQLQINQKANSVDVYYKTEADSIFATKAEIPSDFYSKADVDAKDNAIKAMITSEISAREAEDAALNNAITAETNARQTADTALQNSINSLETQLNSKLNEVKAKDVSVSVDNTVQNKPEIKVNISSENDQIIKLNADGIYAKSSLGYDEEHNILLFTNTTGTTAIALKTKSEIDNIYYDKPNERIVIEYTVNGTRKEDVYVPVHDLIEEWRTEDGNVGAIALTKEISIPDADVLKARLVLNTTHSDNAAVIDDNALYVSKNAITSELNAEITALKARVAALENALQAATTEHQTQSTRITAVEQKNTAQDDLIAEINALDVRQNRALLDLGYDENELEP